MKTKEVLNDRVIDEIREIRHHVSERFGHDPEKIVAHYVQLQERYKDRLIGAIKRADDSEETQA